MVSHGLCIGLDFEADFEDYVKYIESVDADVYKFNPAFNPHIILQLSEYFRENNILWIYDGKLGDVYHTNVLYADYVFNELGAWGVTLNPYVGLDALQPFFNYNDKYSFILCKTTNKGSEDFQRGSYRKIFDFIVDKSNIGLVYAGNDEIGLKEVSLKHPSNLILAPGIGVQGGVIKHQLENVIYSVSRSIYKSLSPKKTCELFKYKIKPNYLLSLFKPYVKEGDFILSSGERSGYYIDLKSLTEDVFLFDLVTSILSEKISSDSILGIESGSISFASVAAFKSKKSFGFIRKQSKDYATGNLVEGLSSVNKEVTIVEDVLTTGKSLEEAISKAESCGFKIKQVVVLLCRNKGYKSKYPMTYLASFP